MQEVVGSNQGGARSDGIICKYLPQFWVYPTFSMRSRSQYVVVRLSVFLSVTLVRPTQAIEIFGNVSKPFGTMAICWHQGKILQRSFQGNPPTGELNTRGVAEYINFGPIERYISETVQDRS